MKVHRPVQATLIALALLASLLPISPVAGGGEATVQCAPPSLTAVDQEANLYRATFGGKEFYGTLEALSDFAPLNAATLDAAAKLHSKSQTCENGVVVEAVGAIAGTCAQGRVNPFPVDIDLSEQVLVTADCPRQAGKALARMVQETVARATQVPESVTRKDGRRSLQFLGMKCGFYPADAEKRGEAIRWQASEVVAGTHTYVTQTGDRATITLAAAFANPHPQRVCNTYWRGPINSRESFGEITKVIVYKAVNRCTGKKMFATPPMGQAFQEVCFAGPLIFDNDRQKLIDDLTPQITRYARAGNWLKAVKRCLTTARAHGDVAAVEDAAILLSGEHSARRTVCEQAELFVEEIVNNAQSNSAAVGVEISADEAREYAHQIAYGIGRFDRELGQRMSTIVNDIPNDLRHNGDAFGRLKTDILKPLHASLLEDCEFNDRAREVLEKHGYLKSGLPYCGASTFAHATLAQ